VAIAPDGSWLVAASRHEEIVRVWDPASSTQKPAFTGHTGGVAALAIAPDGTWLATGDGQGVVRLWDTASRIQIAELAGHTGGVTAVAIAPDGTWLATCGDATVRVWNAVSKEAVTMMRTDGAPLACAWMPDAAGLVVGGNRGAYIYSFQPGIPDA
jgi:WD40 repeat protein